MIYYHVERTIPIQEENFQLGFKGGIGAFWREKDKEVFLRIVECENAWNHGKANTN